MWERRLPQVMTILPTRARVSRPRSDGGAVPLRAKDLFTCARTISPTLRAHLDDAAPASTRRSGRRLRLRRLAVGDSGRLVQCTTKMRRSSSACAGMAVQVVAEAHADQQQAQAFI